MKIGGVQNDVSFQCHMLLSYSFALFFFCTKCFYLPSTSLHLHGTSKSVCMCASQYWFCLIVENNGISVVVLDQIDVFIGTCVGWRQLKENLAIGNKSNFLNWDLAERSLSRY